MSEDDDYDPREAIAANAHSQHQVQIRENQEAKFTRKILTRFAPRLSIPQALNRLERKALTLEVLPLLLENFPVQLAADAVRYLDEIAASDLLGGNLPATPLWRAYVAAVERRGVDIRQTFFGLITPWRGSSSVVLHNWPRHEENIDRGKSYGRFVLFSCKHSTTPILYSLEPLDAFLDAVAASGVKSAEFG